MRLRGLTVLLVEDDPDNLELIAAYLEAEGAVALGAASIEAALLVSRDQPPDVLVSDLELHDGNGCALLEALRRREGLSDLPAIAITGYSQRKWRDKASDCGFSRYAVKPFSLEQLVEWIAELSARASGVSEATCHVVAPRDARGRLAR